MAASTTPINSSKYYIAISTDGGSSYDRIGYATEANANLGMDTREITNKFSAGWRELAEGKRNWSFGGSGLVVYDDDAGDLTPIDIMPLFLNRTKVKVKFTTANTGDYEMTGDAWLTSYNKSAGVEDNLGYDFTFEGTGALTHTAVA